MSMVAEGGVGALLAFPGESREKGEKAMIARFDHRPVLTAVLALSTIVLIAVVITLATLLITAAPPAATSSSESGGQPGGRLAVPGNGDFYGEGWNNYGHDMDRPYPTRTGDSVESHHEMPSAHYGL